MNDNDNESIKYCDSFLIVEKDIPKNRNKKIKNKINNASKDEETVESIFIPFNKTIREIPYKEESIHSIRRSESMDKSSSIFIDKKKDEFFLDNLGLDFEIMEKNKIEGIKPFKSKCILYEKNISFDGNLIVNKKYEINFIVDKNKNKLLYNDEYYKFSLLYIKDIIPNTNYFGQINYFIEIILKDNRTFLFKFPITTYDFFISSISKYTKPEKNSVFFEKAILFKQKEKISDSKESKNYWDLYSIEQEFKRQGIDFQKSNKYFLIDNSSFNICDTYPKKIVVPNLNTKNIIKDINICADFRTKKRLPVLTYCSDNGTCIWRCSQAKSGFNTKNDKDILLLTKIADNKKLIIYDCRPKLNAWVNKFKGAGYENIYHYNKINMDIKFCDIPNIHGVRSSFEQILNNVSYNSDIKDYHDTWYDMIILILKSGFNLYKSIKYDKDTVLIHCSDGWDRTSQLACISQLLLDKYYRTLDGFIILIEKDWISFGHQFRYRNGFYSDKDTPSYVCKENQFSPVFIQWLDCVYQIMIQNLDKFEFNTNLLIFIAKNVYEGKYGNFLFNSEKERCEFNAKKKMQSIWKYVLENKKKFLNPIYNKKNEEEIGINYKKIKLWEEYFYRFEKGENNEIYIDLICNKFKEYKKNIKKKQKILEEMYKLIEKKDKNLITPEMKREIKIKENINNNNINDDNNKNNKIGDYSFVIINKSGLEDIK